MTTPTLSKSKYLAGCQCLRRVWFSCREPELAAPADPAKQAIFDMGHEIGRRAHALFPGGVLVSQDHQEHAEAVERTRVLLADASVPAIFEAAFEHAGVRIRVDALERLPGGRFGLREVKASTEVKPVHVDDCAVQQIVLEGCGLRIASVEIVHVNRAYVRGAGDIDWAAFFARSDLTRKVASALPSVRERIPRFHAVIREPQAPAIEPSAHCFDPYDCEFWQHCTRSKPADWIFHLPRLGKRFETLRASGIERILEIPEEYALPEVHVRIRAALRRGGLHVDPGLADALRDAGPPAHYLDFETANPAIPLYPGAHPYDVIPFQWSLHTDAGDGELRHRAFLAAGDGDPRREFAETLVAALFGEDTPVLVYSPFESTQLGRLAERFPDLAPALRSIRDRLFDLLPIVRSHLYHPGFAFSFSIKQVAPALTPDVVWDDLGEIADGASASSALSALAAGRVAAAEREALRAALSAYCARDTLALARVHRALREVAT
jgi:hypothetical protein